MSSEKSGFFRSLTKRLSRSSTGSYDNMGNPVEPPPAYSETASTHSRTPTGSAFTRSPTQSSTTSSHFSRSPTVSSMHSSNQFASRNPTIQTTPYPPSPEMLHPNRMTSNMGASPYGQAPYRGGSTLSVNTRSSVITRESLSTDDDPYAFLSTFDTIFLIDDSGSMRLTDRGATKSRWLQARDCIEMIAPICASHDEDGLDIYFINHKSRRPADEANGKGPDGYLGTQTPLEVKEIFSSASPTGGTLTGKRLRSIIQPYMNYLEKNKSDLDACKPVNLIVITDGQAQDDVESVVISAAKKLDALDAAPYQLGIQFFQVGSDRGATEALRELDDDLQERASVRDIVDTCPIQLNPDGSEQELTSELILKTVLGAVVKKLDRKVVEQQ
jgi:hypothetical protein